MADAESVNSLVQQCGEVDVIVNNAGSFASTLTVDRGMAAFEATLNTFAARTSWSPD
jgi:NADP-dependent 3-hydroxy acid dehydrogenase YdfG